MPELISLSFSPPFKFDPMIKNESGTGREGVGHRIVDAGRIGGVVVDLVGGGFALVRVVGLIVGDIGVVVVRLGDLMCDVDREFGKAFEPAAEVYCFPVFVN